MPHVSLFRLYSLRAVYLIIALGLALVVWPSVIHHAEPWGLSQGVVKCMLAAFSLLCVIGIRHHHPAGHALEIRDRPLHPATGRPLARRLTPY
jgi:hypothetical protein